MTALLKVIVLTLTVVALSEAGVKFGLFKKSINSRSLGGPDGECPAREGEFPVYLPDTEDCRYFYECNEVGEPIPLECAPGTTWNPSYNWCGPEDTDCIPDDSETTTSKGGEGSSRPTTRDPNENNGNSDGTTEGPTTEGPITVIE